MFPSRNYSIIIFISANKIWDKENSPKAPLFALCEEMKSKSNSGTSWADPENSSKKIEIESVFNWKKHFQFQAHKWKKKFENIGCVSFSNLVCRALGNNKTSERDTLQHIFTNAWNSSKFRCVWLECSSLLGRLNSRRWIGRAKILIPCDTTLWLQSWIFSVSLDFLIETILAFYYMLA